MKNTFIILLTLISFTYEIRAQENTIVFDYDKNGKMLQRKIKVFPVVDLSKPSSVNDTLKKLSFDIFPNPTNKILNINGTLPSGVMKATLNIITINGQIVKSDSYYGKLKSINVDDLTNGVYVLEIICSKEIKSVHKIIVNK